MPVVLLILWIERFRYLGYWMFKSNNAKRFPTVNCMRIISWMYYVKTMTPSAFLVLCKGIHWIRPDLYHKGPVLWSFDVVLDDSFNDETLCLMFTNLHKLKHYNAVIMGAMAFQITNLTIVYSTVYSGADQRKTSKLRVTGLCAGKSPVTGEFPAQRASYAEYCFHLMTSSWHLSN